MVPLSEYPRPQIKRDSYLCLNGLWNYCISKEDNKDILCSKKIMVPYPLESEASLVGKRLNKGEFLYYKKEFLIEKKFLNDHIILHFGAVDQICEIYLNGTFLGKHEGGYLPFFFDVSEYITIGNNTLVVKVSDDLNIDLPYGKQKENNKGMWYTPISGIWQTVWLESVSEDYIENLSFFPDLDNNCINISICSSSPTFKVIIKENGKIIHKNKYRTPDFSIHIDNPILWNPDNPFLYEIEIETKKDKVISYFAMRKFHSDNKYIYLNNKPIFLNGVLDQGYFQKGIYTPLSYKEYENDILKMKELGFNTLRKHIKVEPLMFYYYCDLHGMIVMQDMVNLGKYSFLADTAFPAIGIKKKIGKVSEIQKENFINHSREIINHLHNVVSIGYYTIFNEGWGQFEADKVYEYLSSLDSSRIFDTTSGWFKEHQSDVESLHVYFKPIKLKESDKPIIVSEFGGYSYKVKDHIFSDKTFGYKKFKSQESFEEGFIGLYQKQVIPSIKKGLIGCIYTQLSDVEGEINGILTYDREVCKLSISNISNLMNELYSAFEKSLSK